MAYATPVVAGKMLGLTPEQMQHAIGICSCHRFTLGCAVAGKLTMMKNTVSPMATRDGVEAALLAQRGYTGPEGVIEGKEGHGALPRRRLGLRLDQRKPRRPLDDHRLRHEELPDRGADALAGLGDAPDRQGARPQGRRHQEINIESIARAADILSDPAKYDPQSKESADHSLPYCIAAAVTDGMVTPKQFKDERSGTTAAGADEEGQGRRQRRVREGLPRQAVHARDDHHDRRPQADARARRAQGRPARPDDDRGTEVKFTPWPSRS
jgi:2-methylcitrate dehydratase